MKSNRRLVNFALALYQVIVVCAVVNHHNLVADEKHLVWIGVPVFLVGLFTMPKITRNKYALIIFMLGVLLLGGKEIFYSAIGGFLIIWFMYKTLSDEPVSQTMQNKYNQNVNPVETSHKILYKDVYKEDYEYRRFKELDSSDKFVLYD